MLVVNFYSNIEIPRPIAVVRDKRLYLYARWGIFGSITQNMWCDRIIWNEQVGWLRLSLTPPMGGFNTP